MQTSNNSYEVTIIKKIPYLTEFLFILLIPGVLTLLIAYYFMFPSGQSTNNMQIVAVLRIIPEKVQFLLLYFGLSTILLYPFYKYVKMYRRAMLTFNDQFLSIQGKNVNLKIPVDTISKIYFKEPINYRGDSKKNLTIYIQEKFMNTTTLKLKDYSNADKLITGLTNIDELRPLLAESNTAFYIDSED